MSIALTKVALTYSVLLRATISGISKDSTCTLTQSLSNELGDPESLGRIHEIVHNHVWSSNVNSSESV